MPRVNDPGVVQGHPSSGWMWSATAIAAQGEGFQRIRPDDPVHFATNHVVTAVTTAASNVHREFGPSTVAMIGDLSRPHGGAHRRHRSHRAGLDVDIAFFTRPIHGGPTAEPVRRVPVNGKSPWPRVHRTGATFGVHGDLEFDVARNWALVRELLRQRHARVQWIFCSNGIRSRLLRYAARVEPSSKLLARAVWVLRQPQVGPPHDDHFHVRFLCGQTDIASGCRYVSVRWPWAVDAAGKFSTKSRPSATDGNLTRWLLTDEGAN